MTPWRRLVLTTVRRGSRTVLLTYPGLGVGNHLYFALRAHQHSDMGRDYRVMLDSGVEPWLTAMPALRRHYVEPARLRWWDRREHISPTFFQAFGEDFTRGALEGFISDEVLTSPLFRGWQQRSARLVDEGVLTVNVRRGDYYAVESFRQIYGFDVATYVRTAVAEAHRTRGDFGRIHVVSNGVEWCRRHLDWLEDFAGTVSFVGADDSPQDHLVDVALSPMLVLTNSTFSFWGGYISNVVHQGNAPDVWAPRFFGRGLRPAGSSAWQLDPRWSVVDDVPGT